MPEEYDEPYLMSVSGSLEDYYSIGETKADFLKGMIFMQYSAKVVHEETLLRISYHLFDFIREYKLGRLFGPRLMIIFEKDVRFMPDLFFVSKQNKGRFTRNEFIGIPDLIVEIMTDITRNYDQTVKLEHYKKKNVPEIILADVGEKNLTMEKFEKDKYVKYDFKNKVVPSDAVKGFRWKPDMFFE